MATDTVPPKSDLQQIKDYWRSAVHGFNAFRRARWGGLVVLWAMSYAVLMSSFFTSVTQNNNFVEIYPEEMVIPAIMHVVTALVIALVLFRIRCLRTLAAKMISAVVLSLMMLNFDGNLLAVTNLMRAFTPGLTEQDPLTVPGLVYLLLLVAMSVCLGALCDKCIRRQRIVSSRDVALGMVALVGYLFVVPTFALLQVLPAMVRESDVSAAEFATPTRPANTDKPDIYYIVLDRYASGSVLKQQFNYDNSVFTEFLRSNNYTVNDTAKSSYPYTALSISSTMVANYTNQLVEPFKNDRVQSKSLYHSLTQQSPVVKAIKKAGYKYYNIGSTYGATYKAPLADREYMTQYILTVFGAEKKLRGIAASTFAKSPYFRFAQMNMWPFRLVGYTDTGYSSKQLSSLEYLTAGEPPGGRFITVHMLMPHEPFFFNADGSLSASPTTDNVGKPIKDKYIGQLQYTNSQIQPIIEQIQKQSDGEAVVILSSDEGPYPQVLNDTVRKTALETIGLSGAGVKLDDMRDWPDDWLNMKFGILQAVHIPNATEQDLQQLSSINVFRIVLNRYFGYDLPYLPNCSYGLISGSKDEYLYADITERLQGGTNAVCQSRQSLPNQK